MGAELFAEEGTLKGISLTLDVGEEWVIGRDPDLCQLILEDPAASRMHARIEKQDDQYVIENLSETNPIEVNNHPIRTRKPIEEGDKIKIGGTIFYFYPQGALPTIVRDEEEEGREQNDSSYATIFQYEEEHPEEAHVDLTTPARFILKVIAGPNSGAELALNENRSYSLGTDTASCDVVFHDLSVSRQHARIDVKENGQIFIEDLNSRNGVTIDRKRIETKAELLPNQVVILGTSAFLVVDREAPTRTIVAPTFELPQEKVEVVAAPLKGAEEEVVSPIEPPPPIPEEVVVVKAPKKFSPGALLLSTILGAFAIFIGLGLISLLLSGKEITPLKRDYQQELSGALKQFTGVKFNYNPLSCRLFLVGHVVTGVEKNELLYNLRGLNFIKGIDDNVVIDECVWQEFNTLIGNNAAWKGVSMHSPDPGTFVLSGYLQKNDQAVSLVDFMNLNFPYLDRLKNYVVVEEEVVDEATSQLLQSGLGGVAASFNMGELILTGYIHSSSTELLAKLLEQFQAIPGVRVVRSYVVSLTPERSVIDLNEKYPGRYKITGYATRCNVNINVVINGKMYARGDLIDGLTITSIQSHAIYLEREGLKYKIEYSR